MRLCFCYSCKTLSKLDDYEGDFEADGEPVSDHLLENWVQRHMHGMSADVHPGGRVFPFEGRDIEVHDGRLDGVRVEVANEVEQVRSELARAGVEVQALTRRAGDDAHKCFIKHSARCTQTASASTTTTIPSGSGAASRLMGSDSTSQQGYLCSFCPYETAVSIVRRGY